MICERELPSPPDCWVSTALIDATSKVVGSVDPDWARPIDPGKRTKTSSDAVLGNPSLEGKKERSIMDKILNRPRLGVDRFGGVRSRLRLWLRYTRRNLDFSEAVFHSDCAFLFRS